MSVQTVQKAIFPVAGLGTRFLPATKAQPKEMLPVVDKPLIQYAVEEAYAAGVREMIFVTGRHKRPIEDHFDMTFELEVALEQAGKQALLEVVRSVKPDDMECIYVRQAQALGLGHAVLCAQRLIGNDPFAVLLADDLMVGEKPVLQQMAEQFAEWQASIIAVQEVPVEHTKRYGIVAAQYRWSGQIIEPVDGLPFIGLNSAQQHVYVATGYAGNGMTFGTLAAMITSDLILGRENPYAALYDAIAAIQSPRAGLGPRAQACETTAPACGPAQVVTWCSSLDPTPHDGKTATGLTVLPSGSSHASG